MSKASGRIGWTVVIALIAAGMVNAAGSSLPYRSPTDLAITGDGETLFVAEHTANRVAMVALPSGEVLAHIDLDAMPTGLAISPDGARLYVTAGMAPGHVLVFGVPGLQLAGKFAAGHSPTAPVVSPNGRRLYVCSRFENHLLVFDALSGARLDTVALHREPIASAVTPNGAKLVVANHLPAGAADDAYSASVVDIVKTKNLSVAASVALPNGSNALKDVCLSNDGRYAYVTHVLARYQLPTTQLERGWMNTNALSILDLNSDSLLTTVLLDNVDRGAANPWGVACTEDGRFLCVAHAGTHEISVIDRPGLHAKLDRLAAGEAVSNVSQTMEDVPTDLAFLVDLRERVKLPGNGPRAMLTHGNQAIVAEYFTGDLAKLTLKGLDDTKVTPMVLGPVEEPTETRLGEMYFHDAELCFQQWQSCTSCHPGMRSDGLNWDLLNDGMGNPKNSKSLLLSHATPPVMISGIRPDAETAVRAGIKYIQFAVRPEEDAEAIDAFLRSLAPTPSPWPADDATRRGAEVFQKAECAACHSGPYFTDQTKYNVGTGLGRQADWEFDTPMLVEIWRTAPYLHDGRAATLEDVLTKYNTDDQHGKTSGLTERERSDLVAYLLSL